MKITEKGKRYTFVEFGKLRNGATFVDPNHMGDDRIVLMKVGQDWDDIIKDDEEFDWVAVRLDNGDIVGYRGEEEVVKVDVNATYSFDDNDDDDEGE